MKNHDANWDRMFYEKYGYTLTCGLWPGYILDAIYHEAHRLAGPDFAPLMQPHRHSDVFARALGNRLVVEILREIIGGPVSGLQTQLFFCKPGTKGFSRHQDNAYVQGPHDGFVSVWTAIEDATPDNGCLVMYPGTHVYPILPDEDCPSYEPQRGQDPNANKRQTVVPPGIDRVVCPVPRGGSVFLHGHTVHSSLSNRSDRGRMALLCTYIRRGAAFRPGNNAKRAEVEL